MAVATLLEVPESDAAFWKWAQDHAMHHIAILNALAQDQVFLDGFVLDPVDRNNMEAWLDQHWTMHQQMDQVLNIESNDLSELDWENTVQRNDWFAKHFAEHEQAAAILKIG